MTMPSPEYKRLCKDLHAAIDTGNEDAARETLQDVMDANQHRTISPYELADLVADFHLAFPDTH